LDSRDWASYHDRGLAKMQLSRDYSAISDFDAAIKIKPRDRQHTSYESNPAAPAVKREAEEDWS